MSAAGAGIAAGAGAGIDTAEHLAAAVAALPFRTVTVCTSGNSAHTCVGYFGSKGMRVRLLTRHPEDFGDEIVVTTKDSAWESRGEFRGKLEKASADPAEVVPGSDLVIIAGPSHAALPILRGVAPHLEPGTWVGTLFAQGGFDWVCRAALGSKMTDGTVPCVFGLQNIPWINIKTAHGKSSKIAGPKEKLYVAASPPAMAVEAARKVEGLFDIPCDTLPNFLAVTLTPSNQIIHPARYYAIFRDWDGKSSVPRAAVPTTLYASFDEAAAEHLAVLDNELQQVKSGLLARYPDLDLSTVLPIGERVCKQYGKQVADSSSLRAIFATNQGYAACMTPVVPQPDGSVKPAVASRLFWEDIPYGLCILKNLAELMTIPTPRIDHMIAWHQQWMGKRFIDTETNTLNAEAVGETGAPAAYGLHTLDDIVAASLPAGGRARLFPDRMSKL